MSPSTRLSSAFVMIVAISMAVATVLTVTPASALSGSDWNAGKIMSDDLFFKSDSMSVVDIQNFLNSMVPNCDTSGSQPYAGTSAAAYGTSRGYPPPYTCLKDYYENPTTHQNNANGGSVSGGASAAEIIKYAADTYGISPKVLLVLLQKEQSLVTDSWPWTIQYRSATGYGCPDTAPCDAEYYGFYNQVTKAAYQFKRYAQFPGEYRYKAFQTNYIQWNPNSSCGGQDVYIHNQATAALYNYTPYQPNSAALNNLYGMGDSCSAYGNRNFWRMYNDWFGSTQYEEVFLSYKSHVSNLGWTAATTNNGTTGTTGQSKTMEAFKINGSVEYASYNHATGWQPTINGGMISGTTGLSTPIQALKINPLGTLADKYDLYYRVHVSHIGWMGWTKNGQPAGVTGNSTNNIEALEIRLVIKGYSITGSTENSYQNISTAIYNPPLSLNVSSHVGGIGWQPTVRDSMTSGTTEQNRRIEALRLSVVNTTGFAGDIIYAAHVAGIGWQDFKSNNDIAGTTGQSRQVEAVRIALSGQLGDNYDVWYRGYVQYMGWLGWAQNGSPSGSVGASRQLEAIEIRIAPKGSVAFNESGNLYNPTGQPVPEDYTVIYSTHVAYVGWVSNIRQNVTAGTTGQGRPLEAARFDITSSIFGDIAITCNAYVKNTGWTNDIAQGGICGTTGQTKSLEAIKLGLSGTASSKYDLYYKVHLSYAGWQEWAKNTEQVGTPGSGRQIEAIIIKLVKK